MNEFAAILQLRRERQARDPRFGAFGFSIKGAIKSVSGAASGVVHAATGAARTVGSLAVRTSVASFAIPTSLVAHAATTVGARLGIPGARQAQSITGLGAAVSTSLVPGGGSVAPAFLPAPSAPRGLPSAGSGQTYQIQPYNPAATPTPSFPRVDAPAPAPAPRPADVVLTPTAPLPSVITPTAPPSYTPPSMTVEQPSGQTATQAAVETIEPTPGVTPSTAPKSSGGAILAGVGAGFMVGGPVGAIAGGVIAHFMTKK